MSAYRRPWLAGLALLAAAAGADAQTRPLQTEEAFTATRGALVLEAGVEAIRAEPNFVTGLERDRWAGPVMRLVHSPSDNVEIDLEWTARVGQRDDPAFGTVSDWGDVALRAKVRLAEEGRGRPALAARFGVTLPQTSFGNGLGPNALRMSAQVLLSKSAGSFLLHGNVGLALHDEVLRPHEQRDFLAYGVALARGVGRAVSLVAEWAGLAGRGSPGADAHAELRGGLRFGAGRLRGDVAVRRGLLAADGTWGLTVGLSARLR
ncbi:MAG TPA: hypothetical protein VMR21_11085 [Vicinamibacteria bacterium]|nr:hypothetical protein [Vicinamibacteria bacterium]